MTIFLPFITLAVAIFSVAHVAVEYMNIVHVYA